MKLTNCLLIPIGALCAYSQEIPIIDAGFPSKLCKTPSPNEYMSDGRITECLNGLDKYKKLLEYRIKNVEEIEKVYQTRLKGFLDDKN